MCTSCLSTPARYRHRWPLGAVWDGIRPIHGLTVNTRQAGTRMLSRGKGVSMCFHIRRHSACA
ncbi:hypothetical protein GT037_005648 [Alternaria burnsii]|uniref:Uncharacterized protein n=1 Tax=Alternaria burnsii TaxID=1187904 RepID=A0A8H7B2L0_9PLEO|nr:uncharacterized protein GT037_005648 [Alternaria burnsii]KAF7676143.1 hypothetical protein GT037_005648 [Alternaria burnsii]